MPDCPLQQSRAGFCSCDGHTANTLACSCLEPWHCMFSWQKSHCSWIFLWRAPCCHSDLRLQNHLIRAFSDSQITPYLIYSTSPYLNSQQCTHHALIFVLFICWSLPLLECVFPLEKCPSYSLCQKLPTPPSATPNYHLSGHSFIEQILTEHLLCARPNHRVTWYCPNQSPFLLCKLTALTDISVWKMFLRLRLFWDSEYNKMMFKESSKGTYWTCIYVDEGGRRLFSCHPKNLKVNSHQRIKKKMAHEVRNTCWPWTQSSFFFF